MFGRYRLPVLVSLTALVAVNLIPLVGAVAWGWKASTILLLFWAENVVIGLWNALRMLTRTLAVREWKGLFLTPFFIVHYGLFCAGHGFFLFAIFLAIDPASRAGQASPDGPFGMIAALMGDRALSWAVLGLVLSHGVSFVGNFLLGGEMRRTPVNELMGAPYGRIMILHVTIIFGAFVVLSLGQPVYALVVLVLIKIGVDVAAHLRERRKLGGAGEVQVAMSTRA